VSLDSLRSTTGTKYYYIYYHHHYQHWLDSSFPVLQLKLYSAFWHRILFPAKGRLWLVTELFVPVVTIYILAVWYPSVSMWQYFRTQYYRAVLCTGSCQLVWFVSSWSKRSMTDPHHVNRSLRSQAFKSNVLNKKCENIFTRERNNVDWPLSSSSIPQRRTVRPSEEPNHIFLFATSTMKCRVFHVTLDKKRTFKRFLLDLAVECILIDCIHSHALSWDDTDTAYFLKGFCGSTVPRSQQNKSDKIWQIHGNVNWNNRASLILKRWQGGALKRWAAGIQGEKGTLRSLQLAMRLLLAVWNLKEH
jgi:hypothetical protein